MTQFENESLARYFRYCAYRNIHPRFGLVFRLENEKYRQRMMDDAIADAEIKSPFYFFYKKKVYVAVYITYESADEYNFMDIDPRKRVRVQTFFTCIETALENIPHKN